TPATPKVSKLVKGAKKVTGSTTKGATVYAKIGNKTYKATASTKTGSFSIKVPTLKEKTKVKVYAKKSNYTSKSVTVTVKSK
ncbi:MAG: lytic transglycosylase domain-containing protein, partial [Kurthia sp.]|nr:lytic transglycosylase domain-containing protein [Kurthia sp.]